jgi:hypothetical protein
MIKLRVMREAVSRIAALSRLHPGYDPYGYCVAFRADSPHIYAQLEGLDAQ